MFLPNNIFKSTLLPQWLLLAYVAVQSFVTNADLSGEILPQVPSTELVTDLEFLSAAKTCHFPQKAKQKWGFPYPAALNCNAIHWQNQQIQHQWNVLQTQVLVFDKPTFFYQSIISPSSKEEAATIPFLS